MARICDRCGVVHEGECAKPATEKEVMERIARMQKAVIDAQRKTIGSKLEFKEMK